MNCDEFEEFIHRKPKKDRDLQAFDEVDSELIRMDDRVWNFLERTETYEEYQALPKESRDYICGMFDGLSWLIFERRKRLDKLKKQGGRP
jgi:hypothetical protein